jgi:hypothetical protein
MSQKHKCPDCGATLPDEYRESIGRRPRYAEVHTNLSLSLRDQGSPVGAIAEHREAIRIDPRDDAPVATLPEPKRIACQALWAEVDKVLKACEGGSL